MKFEKSETEVKIATNLQIFCETNLCHRWRGLILWEKILLQINRLSKANKTLKQQTQECIFYGYCNEIRSKENTISSLFWSASMANKQKR